MISCRAPHEPPSAKSAEALVREGRTKLAGGEEARIEYRIRRPDGSPRWNEDRRGPLRMTEAGPDRVAGVAMDMNETVTSVSKREQKLGDAATAIMVLSNDDIRRSGVTSLADALRLVPGMNVAAVNASQMAVSARGFNGQLKWRF